MSCCTAARPPIVALRYATTLLWMARWWPNHPEYTALFFTDPRAADAPEPGRRAVMLQALAAGGHEAEFERRLAREEMPWAQNRMRHVERLRTAPLAAAPAVYHERLRAVPVRCSTSAGCAWRALAGLLRLVRVWGWASPRT